MITHDVDEAIYLSDRVLLMSPGPKARIQASVQVDFARPRDRKQLIHDPRYYAVRNHMLEFLSEHGPKPRHSEPATSAEPRPGAALTTELAVETQD